ncbi:CDP-glucose 4,6-dehydratase [Agrobacterium rosae]|uniref:CDP-glucose 4,6-dehydratase n=1 Tax=Agrobacterium rosae TaxID=1972867 RepID=A0ABU4W5K4_9HYPH|nr:CDP-glucose 4,6-dehydratase [Agrobacterium rosae]MDX8333068.1 CDP-glucose 4,6-dehydratase [Agrobacterium rosae]
MAGGAKPNHNFWRGKNVFLTGHTGFKGAWLSLWLARMGAKVTGVSLAPTGEPSLFSLASSPIEANYFEDIRNGENLSEITRSASPDIILHLAAQALVRLGYEDPIRTFATNVLGTANLLEASRSVPTTRVIVAVTTDKVYQNLEHSFPYRETDQLGGHDPYSASKAACEIVVSSYRDSFLRSNGVAVATARAGNVIGGGDWSADRLLPDAVRAWQSDIPLHVRRPEAKRPWQHVLEPLSAYLILAERLWDNSNLSGSYNFGPVSHEAAPVRQVIEIAQAAYGRGEVIYGDGTEGPHEAGWLALETAKARHTLDIVPRWHLSEAVTRTMRWYKAHHDGANARTLCEAEIAEYEGPA